MSQNDPGAIRITQVQSRMRQTAHQHGVGQAEVSLLVLTTAPAQPQGSGLPWLLTTWKGFFRCCKHLQVPASSSPLPAVKETYLRDSPVQHRYLLSAMLSKALSGHAAGTGWDEIGFRPVFFTIPWLDMLVSVTGAREIDPSPVEAHSLSSI